MTSTRSARSWVVSAVHGSVARGALLAPPIALFAFASQLAALDGARLWVGVAGAVAAVTFVERFAVCRRAAPWSALALGLAVWAVSAGALLLALALGDRAAGKADPVEVMQALLRGAQELGQRELLLAGAWALPVAFAVCLFSGLSDGVRFSFRNSVLAALAVAACVVPEVLLSRGVRPVALVGGTVAIVAFAWLGLQLATFGALVFLGLAWAVESTLLAPRDEPGLGSRVRALGDELRALEAARRGQVAAEEAPPEATELPGNDPWE